MQGGERAPWRPTVSAGASAPDHFLMVHWPNNRKRCVHPPTLSVRNWTKFQNYK